jgi:hypothetical protein
MAFGRMAIGLLGGLTLGAALLYRRLTSARRHRLTHEHSFANSLSRLRPASESGRMRMPPELVVERVRAAIERAATRPSVIAVRVSDDQVTLYGPVPAREARAVLRSARRAAGRRSVRDQLQRRRDREALLTGAGLA